MSEVLQVLLCYRSRRFKTPEIYYRRRGGSAIGGA